MLTLIGALERTGKSLICTTSSAIVADPAEPTLNRSRFGGRGSDQLSKIIALSEQFGAGVYFGKGFNRYSDVHIADLVAPYLFAVEKAPGGSFFSAENSDASNEIAEVLSRMLDFEGRTASLSAEDIVQQSGEEGRYGLTSNSRVSAVLDSAQRTGQSVLFSWFPTPGTPDR